MKILRKNFEVSDKMTSNNSVSMIERDPELGFQRQASFALRFS